MGDDEKGPNLNVICNRSAESIATASDLVARLGPPFRSDSLQGPILAYIELRGRFTAHCIRRVRSRRPPFPGSGRAIENKIPTNTSSRGSALRLGNVNDYGVGPWAQKRTAS